ncbi:hypothetical protein [Saccharothrix coeruleofusca]|uniref:PknH-like protein n=1 Tax=Saccharothrix coeruleofusca TaxID=33919 RepID=A0A918APY9_9PSEU|nr:hypothetical protein [Saccharothrix coeruleofusca]GGP66721.1 hypothetical protein GCM10010185_44420 [Saccharothrix coeruleofusca]
MRHGGTFLALLVLAGCSAAPVASTTATSSSATPTTTTTTTAARPDPALIEPRLRQAQLPDDVLAPLGYTRNSSGEQKNYTVVLCPGELSTDGAMSATRMAADWIDRSGFYLHQYSVSYWRVAAAAETVELSRKALECGTFEYGGTSYTIAGELSLPQLGADAQFSYCARNGLESACQLVLSKADLMVSFTYFGADTTAAEVLETAGRAVVPRLSA